MKLKLYHAAKNPFFCNNNEWPEHDTSYHKHDMFVFIDKDKWELTANIEEADIIPIIPASEEDWFFERIKSLVREDQIVMVMNTFHCDDYMTSAWYRGSDWVKYFISHKKTIIVHTNPLDTDHPKFVFYDMIFNREKYYLFDLDEDFDITNKVWTEFADREFYSLGPIDKQYSPENRKIMCLNRLYWPDDIDREQKTLRSQLQTLFRNNREVYLSEPHNNKYFYPNGPRESHQNIAGQIPYGGTWYPAGDVYYNTSYVSAFIESVVQPSNNGFIYCCSEKTLDPLVKGNFIIPFSSPHFIKHTREIYGFKFPDWIDYSYDEIENLQDRAKAFLSSVYNVMQMSVEELHQHYLNDKSLLEHNRSVIKNRPYDSLYDKVHNSVTKLGWR